MVALYKLPCSKLGKVIRQTWARRNGHSITAPGATVRRASANTPKKWRPQRRSLVARRRRSEADARQDNSARRSPNDYCGVVLDLESLRIGRVNRCQNALSNGA